MATTSKFPTKLATLQKALASFSQALDLKFNHLSELETDLIEGGQVQKFEYTLELFWKTCKTFLYDMHGVEALSPKNVMKELYNTKYVTVEEYQTCLAMINDRNRLSHIYNEISFHEIHSQLPIYSKLLIEITHRLC